MMNMRDRMRELGITAAVRPSSCPPPAGWPQGSKSWRVTFSCQGKRMSCSFFTEPALSGAPAPEKVLNYLTLDARAGMYSFDDFCHERGYETYFIAAYEAWDDCRHQLNRLIRFLSAEAVQQLLYNTSLDGERVTHA